MLIRFALVLVFTCVLSQTTVSPAVARSGSWIPQQSRNSISQRGSVWVWNRDENGDSLEMTVRGEVEFNDDYTEVKRVADGGSLEVRESRGGSRRRLEIEAGPGGGLSFSYFVNGQNRPYDADAKAWFARVLDEAVTESGLNAGPRAQKILKGRGADGLLDKISRLKSDHVKNLYFQELFKSGRLDARAATRVAGIASRQMSSDHYKAQVLAGLKADKLSREALLLALKGVGGISSDHYKTQVLLKVAESDFDDNAIRSAYIEAAATIGSDHYRAQSLSALLSKGDNSKEALLVALKATAAMSSDHYKAQTLLKLAGERPNDETVRAALIEAARSIKSDYERGRVLSAIIK